MQNPELRGATVLVTGANGDLGAEFVRQALARGAGRVYAATRRPILWEDSRIVPMHVDVDDPGSIDALLQRTADTTILVNSAGTTPAHLLSDGDLDEHRRVLDTNLWGPVGMTRAFAAAMTENGGGTVVNVSSAASWQHRTSSYAVSKAALWAATNVLRAELLQDGVRVVGVHIGYVRSRMGTLALDRLAPPYPELADPADVVKETYDQLEAGAWEILADPRTREVRNALAEPLATMYPELPTTEAVSGMEWWRTNPLATAPAMPLEG
jgi:NAD(P)-dependent dehydrogenase (short-subunit alcohol dehydrogenase family)